MSSNSSGLQPEGVISLDVEFLKWFSETTKVSAKVIAVSGIFANIFVLFVMLKTKKIRENSTNNFILATLSVDCLFAFWISYLVDLVCQGQRKC